MTRFRRGDLSAPFTDEQVETLNRFQRSGWFHPFTCAWRSKHDPWNEGYLVAANDGWHCPVKDCGYYQDWAHAFMADAEWVARMDARRKAMWSDPDD